MNFGAIASISGSLPPGLDPTVLAAKPAADQRKAVAGQFEAIMLRELLGKSLTSLMGGDSTPAGSIYGYLLTDVFSQNLAKAGGLGLGKMIEQQLAPPGAPDAAPAALGTARTLYGSASLPAGPTQS